MAAAAAAARSVKLEDEATCSICLEYFKNPVIIDCGHNFCQACISQCWQGINTNFACPQCRATSSERNFRPNRQLGNLVEMVKLHLPSLKPQENVCEKHQQRLQLFCEDDQEPICVVCDRSRDHRAHTVVPVEEAAQEYKKTLQNSLDKMKTDLEDSRRLTSEENKKETDLEEEFQSQTEKIVRTFEDLHQFLDQEKQDLFSKVEMEHKKNVEEIRMKKTDLEKQNSSFMDQITEMEEKCQQEDVEFLMDVKSLLKRLCITPEKITPHSLEISYEDCLEYERYFIEDNFTSSMKKGDVASRHHGVHGYSDAYLRNLAVSGNFTPNEQSLPNSCTLSAFVQEKIENLKEKIPTELGSIYYKNFEVALTLEQDTIAVDNMYAFRDSRIGYRNQFYH